MKSYFTCVFEIDTTYFKCIYENGFELSSTRAIAAVILQLLRSWRQHCDCVAVSSCNCLQFCNRKYSPYHNSSVHWKTLKLNADAEGRLTASDSFSFVAFEMHYYFIVCCRNCSLEKTVQELITLMHLIQKLLNLSFCN